MNRRKIARVLAVLFIATGVCLPAQAGSLDPPGPPAPTKTAVNETDPRNPIRAVDLPLTISSAGSYYLAEDITTAGNGINIQSDNVTIDLMGFSLSGGTQAGIFAGTRRNITVRNGTVSGWAFSGIDLANASNALVVDVHARDNGDGIKVGPNSSITNSTAENSLGGGFFAGIGSSIIGCVARDNGQDGYFTSGGCTISDSTAYSNGAEGFNLANGNTITRCTATFNGATGIRTTSGSRVGDCTSTFNTGNGILVQSRSYVVGNVCTNNGGAGVLVIANSDNRVDGNHVIGNTTGIEVFGTGNLIIRNSASGNATDYSIVGGNFVGLISTSEAMMNGVPNAFMNVQF